MKEDLIKLIETLDESELSYLYEFAKTLFGG